MKSIPIRSFPQDPKTSGVDSFKIGSVETVLAGKDMKQEVHRHDFYFILALKNGGGVHEIDFVEHPICDDSIFFLRPGQVHRLFLTAGSQGYLLEFNKGFQSFLSSSRRELLRKAATHNASRLKKDRFEKMHSILESMLQEYQAKEPGFQNALAASLELFLIHFLRALDPKPTGSAETSSYQQEKLQEFINLLETKITNTKQVSAYADMLNLSPYQLNSTTKKLLSKTATELIDDQIILEAKRLLLATSGQVNQIADQLGYDDPSYFIRFFKKHTGHSPEAFRQNFR